MALIQRAQPAARSHGWLAFAAALLAPLAAVASAVVLVALKGAGPAADLLPRGVHTYLPAIDVAGVRPIALAAVASASIALLVVRLRPAARPIDRRGVVVFVGVLVASEVALFLGQLAVVSQVVGVPDDSTSVLVSLVAPAALLLAFAAIGSVALALRSRASTEGPVLFLEPGTRRPARLAIATVPPILTEGPPRGPPLLTASQH